MMRKWIALIMAFIMLLMTGCTAKLEIDDPSTYFFPGEDVTH
jgi:hypothetical protein